MKKKINFADGIAEERLFVTKRNLPAKEIMFDYLDELRELGIVNMFGARPFLVKEFDVPPYVAGSILAEWMKTFAKRHKGGAQ